MDNSTAFDDLNMHEQQSQPTSSTSSTNPHLWEINWVRDVFYLALFMVAVSLAWWLRAIIWPVLLALLLAYLMNPMIVWCQRKWGWSRLACVVALCAVAVAAVIGLAAAVLPIAVAQARELVTDLPKYADALGKRRGITQEAVLEELRGKVAELAQNPADNLSYLWGGVVAAIGLMSGAIGAAASKAIGVALFPVCLLYFSWRWPTIVAWPVAFVPASRRKQVNEIAQKMDKAVGGYFRTRLLIALVMGAEFLRDRGTEGRPAGRPSHRPNRPLAGDHGRRARTRTRRRCRCLWLRSAPTSATAKRLCLYVPVKSRADHPAGPRVSQAWRRWLFAHQRSPRFPFQVFIRRLFDRDADALDRSAAERAGRLVFLADSVTAVVADAKPVTGQGELGRLRLHRAFGSDLVVDVELHRAQRLLVGAGAGACELHAERVLAGLQFLARNEVLLGFDAQEVVNVVQLVFAAHVN